MHVNISHQKQGQLLPPLGRVVAKNLLRGQQKDNIMVCNMFYYLPHACKKTWIVYAQTCLLINLLAELEKGDFWSRTYSFGVIDTKAQTLEIMTVLLK